MVKTKVYQQTVQETNDSSILSKAYVAEHGYFDDPYLKLFCTKVVRRSPLIQWGYYIRAKAMDHILKSFLAHFNGNDEKLQIVSIGAGFDASYFRLKNLNLLTNVLYYDVDFPEVIERKINIIKKQKVLSDIIGEFSVNEKVLKSDDYYTIPSDVTDLTKLEAFLLQNKLDFARPTLFFSECALTYVEYGKSKQLCKWISERFEDVSVVLYEQVKPHDAFGHVMMKHFAKIQSPLMRITELSTILKQMALFHDVGFHSTVGFDMNDFYEKCIDGEEKSRVEKLEVFDEFEEWHLKCSHYCIVGGFQGTCVGSLVSLGSQYSTLTQDSCSVIGQFTSISSDVNTMQRFGHSATMLDKNLFLFTGGFGLNQQNKHSKMADGFLLKINKENDDLMFHCKILTQEHSMLYHSLTSLGGDVVFVFGGRQSPTRPVCEYGFYQLDDTSISPKETFMLQDGNAEPGKRWRHAAVRFEDKIYICGGRSLDNVIYNDIWSFGLESHVWKMEELSTVLLPFHTHTVDVWKNNLILYGGLTTHLKVLNQFVVININPSGLTSKLIDFEPSLPPRYSHTSHVIANTLYVIGGVDPTCDTQPPMLLISLETNTWKACHMPKCDPERPLMLHNHCSVFLEDENKIAIVGGGGNCFSFGTHFNEDITLFDIT